MSDTSTPSGGEDAESVWLPCGSFGVPGTPPAELDADPERAWRRWLVKTGRGWAELTPDPADPDPDDEDQEDLDVTPPHLVRALGFDPRHLEDDSYQVAAAGDPSS